MKLKPSYTLADTRWIRGIEVFRAEESSPNQQLAAGTAASTLPEFDAFGNFDDIVKCTTCGIVLDASDRLELISHYRSEWHKRNTFRIAHGKDALPEEKYEEDVEAGDNMSSLSESDDEQRTVEQALGSTHEYFVQDENVFSVYKCILSDDRPLDSNLFRMTIDCAIFMLAGGHFAAAVYHRGTMTHHKTIHRYTVRAKQGGSQAAQDAKGGCASSAGSALRRYNERTLRAEIAPLIKQWSEPLRSTPLIFIRCGSFQRQAFFGDGLFDKADPRLRSFPFETKRPTLEGVKRAYDLLGSVFTHGSVDEFRQQLCSRQERKKRAQQAQRKRREFELADVVDSDDDERMDDEQRRKRDERVQRKQREEQIQKEERDALDPWSEIDKRWRTSVYTAIRNDDVDNLESLLKSSTSLPDDSWRYIAESMHPPDGNTFMHIAAKNGHLKILEFLLDKRLSCALKNEHGEVPFDLAPNKSTRAIFIAFRARCNEDENIDWRSTHIPVPSEKQEKDAEQLEREREKRKIKKDRQKDRIRTKKAEERAVAAEAAAQAEWLALPDREKRARAAEARMARLEAQTQSGPRCYQCGGVLPSRPFEYSSFEFCAPACVAAHRTTQPPAKNI